MKKYVLAFYSLLFSVALFSQQTVKQLYDEYNANTAAFNKKYLNTTITVTGKIWYISAATEDSKRFGRSQHAVALTATGFETFMTCFLDFDDTATLYALRKGDVVTVSGTYGTAGANRVDLYPCKILKAVTPPVKKVAPPAHIPPGKYNVYQAGGNGFEYSYSFTLNGLSSYTMFGTAGSCTYDKAKKVIRFTSGRLKGFAGVYRPVNPNNENDPPSIVLDSGEVPDLSKNKTRYQYGYWHSLNE